MQRAFHVRLDSLTSSSSDNVWADNVCAFNFALGSPFDGVYLFLLLFTQFVAGNGVDTAVNGVDTAVNGTTVNGVETAVVASVAVSDNGVEATIVSVVCGVESQKNCWASQKG